MLLPLSSSRTFLAKGISRGLYLRCPQSRPLSASTMASAADTTEAAVNPSAISTALSEVLTRVRSASQAVGRTNPARLVAVSKTKPAEAARAAYDAGQRHFGENYVQELVAKAPLLPDDVLWHYIGALQTNKSNSLLTVRSLWCVESVDRAKLATALNRACDKVGRTVEGEGAAGPLRVMVQVNTSGEDSKSGCETGDVADLSRFVVEECPLLRLTGLMTIGKVGASEEAFKSLEECRKQVSNVLGEKVGPLELSMGMSGDFETAIGMGSDSVRVGSTIFGARNYGPKP